MKKQSAAASGNHIRALDGLRGALVLYIVLVHASLRLPSAVASHLFGHGFVAVDVFFALSGFVLMHSFLSCGMCFDGGVARYFVKRLRRLLPSLYVGLVWSYGLLVALPAIFGWAGLTEELFTLTAVPVNVLALQNIFGEHGRQLNSDYWFIAMEIQLSLVFCALALAWRRWGALATLAVVAAALLPLIAIGGGWYEFKAQYVMLFVVGMATADVCSRNSTAVAHHKVSYALLVCATTALLLLRFLAGPIDLSPFSFYAVAADIGVAVAAVAVLFLCASLRPNVVSTIFNWPFLRWFGGISYALYLVHSPVLILVQRALESSIDRPEALFAGTLLLSMPIIMLAACALTWFVEHSSIGVRHDRLRTTRKRRVLQQTSL